MSIQPIFLLSLPRSGSTLVQRVVAAHPGVATASEPWLLLPLLSVLHPSMPLATGWDRSVSGALQDFFDELPGGRDDYLREVRSLALRLYEDAAGSGARYFLDKSPPYHLVVEDLARLFPDAKLVFLWRNPLAVVASIVETIWNGRWQVHRSRGDLFHGLANLVSAYRRHHPRAIAVRYEDLLTGAHEEWERLASYLEFDFDPGSLARFSDVALTGRMGDQSGARRYTTLNREPLDKWKRAVCNPLRKEWCRRYLTWIGADRTETMGYDLPALFDELETLSPGYRHMGVDAVDLGESLVRELSRARLSHNALASSWRLLLSSGHSSRVNGVSGDGGASRRRTSCMNGAITGAAPPRQASVGDGLEHLGVPAGDGTDVEHLGAPTARLTTAGGKAGIGQEPCDGRRERTDVADGDR